MSKLLAVLGIVGKSAQPEFEQLLLLRREGGAGVKFPGLREEELIEKRLCGFNCAWEQLDWSCWLV